jgi:hypothetical protein
MIRAIFGFLTIAFTTGPALAAPQILGLVATGEAVPMQCDGGTCTALLSAFCLQKERLPPDFETSYRPAHPGQATLVITMPDGQVQRLEAADLVRFRSRSGYTAIRADLTLAALGIEAPVSVAIEIAPRTAMLPHSRPGDPDPLTAEEIALATGPARLTAETVLEGNSEPARAARVAARLINVLPLHGDIDAAAREDLWRRIAGADAPLRARRMFEACGRTVDQSLGYRLRTCLEERHERLQIENTHEFWESLGGS